MCGRYVPPDEAALDRFWQVNRRSWPGWIKPVFNIAPTMQVPIVLQADDGVYELAAARWGLIPSWWNKASLPSLSFNARSEEAAQKPMWRHSLQTQRCLMPALGWYEWNEHEQTRNERNRKVNQPYFIHATDGAPVAIAGLWSSWVSPDNSIIVSCALLTREAAPSISAIHHRMPVVLTPDDYARWMSVQTPDTDVRHMIAESRQDFEGYPVGVKVNNVRNDDPGLIEPLKKDDLFG